MLRKLFFNFIIIVFIFLIKFFSPAAAYPESFYFNSLKKRLIKDGFSKVCIEKLYKNPKTYFDTKGVSLFFVHSEAKLNYDQFCEKEAIELARNYMKNHNKKLALAQEAYGVEPSVITAIITAQIEISFPLIFFSFPFEFDIVIFSLLLKRILLIISVLIFIFLL